MSRSPQASRLGDRRKTLLVVLALGLAAGGFAWYWRATAADGRVNALLDEVRTQEPPLVERWLVKLGLVRDRRTPLKLASRCPRCSPGRAIPDPSTLDHTRSHNDANAGPSGQEPHDGFH